MFRLETRNKPRGKLVRDADESTCVRIYKESPETLLLQIWAGKRYMAVSLLPQEARAIAEAIVAAADEIQLGEPMSGDELLALVREARETCVGCGKIEAECECNQFDSENK
jgi:hypothetical protein